MVMIYNLQRKFWTWLVRKQTDRGGFEFVKPVKKGWSLTSSVSTQIKKHLQDNTVEEADGAFFR